MSNDAKLGYKSYILWKSGMWTAALASLVLGTCYHTWPDQNHFNFSLELSYVSHLVFICLV